MGMGTDDPLIPLHLDGDVHRHYRKLLDPLFTPKKMAALEPDIRNLADELIDGFIGDGHVELHDAFCVPLPSTIFLRIFGLPVDDAPFLISMKDRILKNEATTRDDAEVIGRAAGRELRAHLRLRLDERRAEGARHDDLLDQFMHFELDGHGLDDDEVVNIMQMFTIAGLDTVTSSLSCIVAWFATAPGVPGAGRGGARPPRGRHRGDHALREPGAVVGARAPRCATPRSTACRSSRARWSTCAGPAPTSIRPRSNTRSRPISTAPRTATSRSPPASTAASARTSPAPSCARRSTSCTGASPSTG